MQKRREQQKRLPKVKLIGGEKDGADAHAKNSWHFKYLGSIFEEGGGQIADVRRRIAMTRQRFGKLRNIWADKGLHQKLRIRLYRASVCSIMTYGSEA